MNKHNEVDQNTAEKHMANETVTGTRIEDIIAIVSDLESETQPQTRRHWS